ncbi:MAG: beta-lactamase family protein [Bryobacterales bacterium]|nr:beta-lactamase family protein [Bryobacterales bacterium]
MMRMTWVGLLLAMAAWAKSPQDAAIAAKMQEMIAAHEVPGAVTVVATPKGLAHLGIAGKAGPGADAKPLRKDSIFWIASMTKPITAVAVLMLQDEGKLSINDKLSKHVPAFAAQQSEVTLRHMLTHTSGMGEATPAETKDARTLADLVPVYASKPLGFAPGSQWRYCQTGINMLARVVEVVSGQSFPDFIAARLLRPLKMKDTTFYLTEAQMPRLVTPARREGDQLIPAQIGLLQGKPATSTNRYPAANGGLFSTGPDYARFARMLLRGGELDGKRYLSSESFKLMTTIQTGDLKAGFIPGHGWGLGVGVVRTPEGQTAMSKPGAFGHGGAYGTQAWIDPQSGVALILMVQRANFRNSDDSPVRLAFQTAAMAGR